MHELCIVTLMTTQRSKKRHTAAKRLLQGVLVALMAGAAFAPGIQGDAPQDIHMAMAMGGPGGGGAGSPGQGGGATGGASAASQPDTGATPPGGKDREGSGDKDGFMPNGENGLMLLADYVAGKGPKGHVSGAGDGPTGGEPGPQDGKPGLPGPDSFQVAENETHDGGVGLGGRGFGGGGGGGGGGGSGGGGTGGDPGGAPSKPGPGDTPPAQTTPPGTGDGGGPVCVLSSGCDLTPPDTSTPPKTSDPTDELPKLPPRGDLPVGEPGAIPEPASWLMMIVGFLSLGAVLRDQRRKAEPA